MTTTYRLEVSSDAAANPNSNRQGLWTSEGFGDATGYDRKRAEQAAAALLEMDGIESVRVLDETTGEVVYAI